MRFPPIAIVGASCIVPGAGTPAELWRNVLELRNLITEPPPGYSGIDPAALLHAGSDHVSSATGDYVSGVNQTEHELAGLVLGNLGCLWRSMAQAELHDIEMHLSPYAAGRAAPHN